ncbi:alpha-L-rhamnosidase C-terminal domain-containing protein [Candidatus Neomarinimicrobiota bacterium]
MINIYNLKIRVFNIIIGIFLFNIQLFAADPDTPTGLTIEIANNGTDVILVADTHPEFGWIMNDTDKNEYQTAYQILVASSIEKLMNNEGDMWDSGIVKSDESINVSYGKESVQLQNGKLYFWKVRNWDKDGNMSPYSSTGRFIKSLGFSDWIAKPIWDGSNKPNEDVGDFAYFRKKLTLPKEKIKYAIAFVTSMDARIQKSPAYKFYINSQLVGIGPFQGYHDKVTYLGYDVTEYLINNSVNVFSAICESSLKEKSFLMQLHIQYENSDTTIITDQTWKSYNAQYIYNPHGTKTTNAYHYVDPYESIDSRKMPVGWMTTAFDDSDWENARERHQYYDRLMAVSKLPFEIEEITPKTIEYLGNGDYDISLGGGNFGWLRLKLDNASPGDTITIRGERDIYPWTAIDWSKWIINESSQILDEVGYVWTDSLQIRGYEGLDILDDSNIKFVAIRNPFNDKAGSFSSSNPLLDEIYEFCKKSIKHLNVDFYWDTPQNERLAYEGGAIIQQMTSYTMDREYALARFASEYQYFEPTWPHEYKMQSILMAWEDFLYTGNIESIKQHWDLLKEKKYDVDCSTNFLIENIAASALDWPPPYLDGYNYEDDDPNNTFIDNVLNGWNYYAYNHLSKMAGYLDHYYPNQNYSAESVKIGKLANSIKNSYNKTFYSKKIKRYIDGINASHAAFHSSFFPIFFDLVEEEIKDDIASYLVTRNMDCGVFGSQFYLGSLYKLNQGAKALELIVSKDKNSWYHVMHELNAANTTEAWDPSGKLDMSKSHTWGSSAGNMIQRGLMGINPLEPGFKKISIKPQIGNLKFANIDFPTIRGTVHVNVTLNAKTYDVGINIPANTTAKVFIKKMHNSGTEVEVDGHIVNGILDRDGDFIVFDNVGSGFHTFKRNLKY